MPEGLFWRWSCPCGEGGACSTAEQADFESGWHMAKCPERPVRMHTAASPEPWHGQARLEVVHA